MKNLNYKDFFIQNIKIPKYVLNKKNTRNHIYVADIETTFINNNHIPFLINFKNIFYEDERTHIINFEKIYENNIYIESDKIILDFLNILRLKSNTNISKKNSPKLIIYFHNLGNFDGLFLLNVINKYPKNFKEMKAIIKDGKIYEIKYDNVYIRDSFMLLPSSLESLSEKILEDKDKKKKINYDLFKNINTVEKNIIEIKEYASYDIKSLSKIIYKLYIEIFNTYHIDITTTLTISSLAFKIFRTNYLKENTISKSNIDYEIENFLRDSYNGGLTNVFKPKSEKKCYYYDVNSLYPFSMLKFMPTNKGYWIENPETEVCKKTLKSTKYHIFGFIKCTIYIPEYLNIPPLSIKYNNLLINPTGTITGTWFTEEILNALNKYNCKIITIHKILNYNKGFIFNDFVNEFYKKKSTADKESRLFYKLILNSLYGRFALKTELEETLFVDEKEAYKSELYYQVKRWYSNFQRPELDNIQLITRKYPKEPIDEHFVLNHLKLNKEDKDSLLKEISIHKKKILNLNISVQISSAITSYSRIYLINTMNDEELKGNKIFYTDTDSIICEKKLDENKVDNTTLGNFKLEYTPSEAYFIAPKIYLLKNNDKWILKFKGLNNTEKNEFINNNEKIKNLQTLKPITESIINKFKKNLTDLTISLTEKNILFCLESNKRLKIFNNLKEWIDTKPHNIQDDNLTIIPEYEYPNKESNNIWNKLKNIKIIKKNNLI